MIKTFVFGLGIPIALILVIIYCAMEADNKDFKEKCYSVAASTEGAKVIYANKVNYNENCLIKLVDGRVVAVEALIEKVEKNRDEKR